MWSASDDRERMRDMSIFIALSAAIAVTGGDAASPVHAPKGRAIPATTKRLIRRDRAGCPRSWTPHS
jgi:hypothetical protein